MSDKKDEASGSKDEESKSKEGESRQKSKNENAISEDTDYSSSSTAQPPPIGRKKKVRRSIRERSQRKATEAPENDPENQYKSPQSSSDEYLDFASSVEEIKSSTPVRPPNIPRRLLRIPESSEESISPPATQGLPQKPVITKQTIDTDDREKTSNLEEQKEAEKSEILQETADPQEQQKPKKSKSVILPKFPEEGYSDSDTDRARKRMEDDQDIRKSKSQTTASSFVTNLKSGAVFIYIAIPPDGGYALFVCLISFLCQCIVDGIIFSLGIMLPFMAQDFGSTPSKIALVASTQIGPVTSAFINKYGFRPVAFVGAFLSISNILIASFSPDLSIMIIFYSIFGGVSLNMIWVPSQLVIGYYFEKYRPIASGISCSGAGIGVLLFSYLNSVLAPKIGWRNTSRVHVIFLVFVLFFCLAYIEVKPTRIGRMVDLNPLDDESDSTDNEDYVRSVRYSRLTMQFKERPAERRTTIMANRFVEYEGAHDERYSQLNAGCLRCCPLLRRIQARKTRYRGPNETHLIIHQDLVDRQDAYYMGPAEYRDEIQETDKKVATTDVEVEIFPQPRQTMRSINHNLSMMDRQRHAHGSREKDRGRRRTIKKNKCANFLSPSNWVHPKIARAFRIIFDLSLLKVMEFQVLFASAFIYTLGFNIPFVYSKVRAEIQEDYLISPIIGLANFLFRIISGFAAYKFRKGTTYICATGIMYGGVCTLASAFYGIDKPWFQFAYAVSFAIAPAFYATLRAIIYVQMLGLDNLTNAFGLAAMGMGMGVFIGTFTAGTLIEYTKGYTAAYIFSGCCMMVGGSLKLILPALVKAKHSRKSKQ